MKHVVLICVFVLFLSCREGERNRIAGISLPSITGSILHLEELASNQNSVFIFMSPDCPLCINYTKTITDLEKHFTANQVKFIIVFPGTYYSKEEIQTFLNKYHLNLVSLLDEKYLLTKQLKATVTPQAVMLNNRGQIIYSGAVDNRMYHTGRKRSVVNENYLEDAIAAQLQNKSPDPAFTEPVGCFIEL